MATPSQPSFSFLEKFVLEALQSHGFDKLSPADQVSFFPQFMAEAEERLGIALLPRLTSESAAKELDVLLQKESAPEEWSIFWKKHVPDFTAVVKDTLQKFASELSVAFKV
ncbi:MAG: hypothetical protein HY983_01335 [Candidatus Magasanikbacteria bacterium]|nr:hypothetical protein [Candidatus Magasanikbacteria bacterium]